MKSYQQSRQPSGLQKWAAYDGRSAFAWLYLASLFCISHFSSISSLPLKASGRSQDTASIFISVLLLSTCSSISPFSNLWVIHLPTSSLLAFVNLASGITYLGNTTLRPFRLILAEVDRALSTRPSISNNL